MADYYDALKSAVKNLPSADRQARHAFFRRAHELMLQRLRTADPPIEADEIRVEIDAFDAAIRRIEAEFEPHRAPRAAPPVAPPAAPPRGPEPTRAPQQPAPRTPAQRPAPAPGSQGAPPPAGGPQPGPRVAPAASAPPSAPAAAAPAVVPQKRPDIVEPSQRPTESSDASSADSPAPEIAARTSDAAARKLGMVGLVIGGVALLGAAVVGYLLFLHDAPPRTTVQRPAVSSVAPAPARKEEASADNVPYSLRRQLVYYRTVQPPDTIVIAKSQHFLYVVKPNSAALRYTFGMGPDCMELAGLYPVRKEGTPPSPPEADTRALYLGDTKCRIRLIDPKGAIAQNVRAPGLQLVEDDFGDLFNRTDLNTRVVVTN